MVVGVVKGKEADSEAKRSISPEYLSLVKKNGESVNHPWQKRGEWQNHIARRVDEHRISDNPSVKIELELPLEGARVCLK